MTALDSRSIAFEELALSNDADAAPDDGWEIAETEIRELSAYGFDSDDRTLVGLGSSRSLHASDAHLFASEDQTLVGLGPAKRKAAETAEHEQEAAEAEEETAEHEQEAVEPEEEAADSVPMPPSEMPGPFVASDDEAPPRLPMRRGWAWALALPALLVAAAAALVARGIVPRAATPANMLSAAIKAPQTTAALVPTVAAINPLVPVDAPEPEAPPVAAAPASLPAPAEPIEPAALPLPPFAKKAESTSATRGLLDISSTPPSSVVLDGRPLGKVPRTVHLAPGAHTVVFIHPERGRMSVSVNVSAGRTTNASANF